MLYLLAHCHSAHSDLGLYAVAVAAALAALWAISPWNEPAREDA